MTRYTSQTISNFNQTPPSDDGSQTSNNQAEWSKHVDKLATPVKDLAEAINSELANFDGNIFPSGTSSATTTSSVASSQNGKLILASNTITLTLPSAATVGSDWMVAVKNTGSGVITIDGASSETIDGSTTITLDNQNDAVLLQSDGTNFRIVGRYLTTANGITGEMKMWPTGTAPTGYLLCDGAAVSRSTYADLFDVIGTTYGPGDSSTTFNVPDLTGRIPIGSGTGDASDATAHALGDKEGTETHTLTTSEMPSHSHSTDATKDGGAQAHQSGSGISRSLASIGNTGGDNAHNNLQPSLTVNFIIKT